MVEEEIVEIVESIGIEADSLHLLRRSNFTKLVSHVRELLLLVYKPEYIYDELIILILCRVDPKIPNVFALDSWIVHPEYIDNLSKIKQPEQRSPEWYAFRKERLTASDIATALGQNKYNQPKEVILKKCGVEKPFYMSPPCLHGVKYEPVACAIYEKRHDTTVLEFGCLAHPKYPFIGASPDGIRKDGIMLEIKNPYSRKIVGVPPKNYWIQMQIQLEVCDLEICDFLECTYYQYESYQDLLDGKAEENGDHPEFGVFVEYYASADPKAALQQYCDLDTTVEEKEEWVKHTCAQISAEGCAYPPRVIWWSLKEYAEFRVFRDTFWFNRRLSDLRNFWDKIVRFRESGEYKALIPKKKTKKAKKCMFLMDEPDQEPDQEPDPS